MKKKSRREFLYRGKKDSLEALIFNTVLTGCFYIGGVLLAVGIILYLRYALNQNIEASITLNRNVSLLLSSNLDLESLCKSVMDTYGSFREEENEPAGTEAYSKKFEDIQTSKDYQTALSLLEDIYSQSDSITDVYIGMYDTENNALVYIADPSKDDPRRPGDVDHVNDREVRIFLTRSQKELYAINLSLKTGWAAISGIPLYDRDGNIYAFILSDLSLTDLLRGVNAFILYYLIIGIMATIILGYRLTEKVRIKLVVPINDLTEAAKHYVYDRRAGFSSNKHFSSLEISDRAELGKLVLVLQDMERKVSDYEESIKKSIAERERINTELTLAARIQAHAIPSVFPAYPDKTEFDIYASMHPAKEVGGDFYDFFLVDENHLGLVIADVSGKGVPAALFMMSSMILINTLSLSNYSPSEVFNRMNKRISSSNPDYMFVTAWLGILDLRTGKLAACNAGHEYPVIKRPNGTFEIIKDYHEFVIGGYPKINYRNYELMLEPETVLYLYTDGVAEALNEEGELYSMERLIDVLNRTEDTDPKNILDSITKDINEFIAETPQYDDITMMCLRYNGP